MLTASPSIWNDHGCRLSLSPPKRQIGGHGDPDEPQVTYGEDVVSRINYAASHPAGLERLRHSIVDALNRWPGPSLERTTFFRKIFWS